MVCAKHLRTFARLRVLFVSHPARTALDPARLLVMATWVGESVGEYAGNNFYEAFRVPLANGTTIELRTGSFHHWPMPRPAAAGSLAKALAAARGPSDRTTRSHGAGIGGDGFDTADAAADTAETAGGSTAPTSATTTTTTAVAELLQAWENMDGEQLCCLRLYLRPEDTPSGRLPHKHGAHELLACYARVVRKLSDLPQLLPLDTPPSPPLQVVGFNEYCRRMAVLRQAGQHVPQDTVPAAEEEEEAQTSAGAATTVQLFYCCGGFRDLALEAQLERSADDDGDDDRDSLSDEQMSEHD